MNGFRDSLEDKPAAGGVIIKPHTGMHAVTAGTRCCVADGSKARVGATQRAGRLVLTLE